MEASWRPCSWAGDQSTRAQASGQVTRLRGSTPGVCPDASREQLPRPCSLGLGSIAPENLPLPAALKAAMASGVSPGSWDFDNPQVGTSGVHFPSCLTDLALLEPRSYIVGMQC